MEIEFAVATAPNDSSTVIGFGDSPLRRQIVSVEADPLQGTFQGGLISTQQSGQGAAARPKLELPSRSSDGTVRLRLTGESGQPYAIETSTDLVKWVTFKTVTLTSGATDIVDDGARKLSGRFYRIRRAP